MPTWNDNFFAVHVHRQTILLNNNRVLKAHCCLLVGLEMQGSSWVVVATVVPTLTHLWEVCTVHTYARVMLVGGVL